MAKGSIEQQMWNQLFAIINASKLASELDEQTVINSLNQYLNIQSGVNDALKANVKLIRGFLGTYNANSNTPTLSDLTGFEGDTYLVTVAGSQDFGSGAVAMAVNDVIEFRESQWRLRSVSNVVTQTSRVLSGGMVWVSGLTYESVDLVYIGSNGITFPIPDGTQVTYATADGTDPRLDLIYGDDSGNLGVSTGTPAPVPSANTLPIYQLQLKISLIPALETEPSGVSIRTVYTDNAGQPTNFTATENTSGARINVANATAPIIAPVDIKVIANLNNGDKIDLDHATATTFANFSSITFDIFNTQAWGNDYIVLELRNGATITARVTINSAILDINNTTSVQTITIFKSAFTMVSADTEFNGLTFYCRIIGGSAMRYQLDEIYINEDSGTTQPSIFTSPLTTKGDLFTFDTSDTRLPIGADEQVLIADSSQSKGMRWGNMDGGSL